MRSLCCRANSAAVEIFRPSVETVVFPVLAKRKHFKILYLVVCLVSVLVVDAFVGFKSPPQMLLHDVAVLSDPASAIGSKFDITSSIYPFAASESCRTSSGSVLGVALYPAELHLAVTDAARLHFKLYGALNALAGYQRFSHQFASARSRARFPPGDGGVVDFEYDATNRAFKFSHRPIIALNVARVPAVTITRVT